MAGGMTTNAGVRDTNILAVKASKSGKVGSTCPVDYEAATNGTAKSIWSSGEVLNLDDQVAVLTTAGPALTTSDANLSVEKVCDVPEP